MRVLKWLDKHIEEIILSFLMLCIIVVMLYQIIRRYVFNSSLVWSEEFCRYCFIWFMFIGYSYSIRLGSELRVDVLVNLMPPAIKRGIEAFVMVFCLAVTAFAFYLSFGTVEHVIKTREVSAGLKLPMAYVYDSMVVGYGLAVIRSIQKIYFTVKGWLTKEEVK